MGRQAWETIWGPMLRGKFGDRADEISMSWLWAKLRSRRQAGGDEAKEERLVYPRNSSRRYSGGWRSGYATTAGGC